jgi:hypothetical protein
MSKWKWVLHEGKHIYDVGIFDDGTLHNPRGYPPEIVRAAVLAADASQHARRSVAAKKAAVTRAKRQAQKVYRIVKRIVEGHSIGPRTNCVVCGRGLADQQSIDRGIGSECWQDVLSELQKETTS